MSINPFQPGSYDSRRRESQKLMMMISSLTLIAAALAGTAGESAEAGTNLRLTHQAQAAQAISINPAAEIEAQQTEASAPLALPEADRTKKNRS